MTIYLRYAFAGQEVALGTFVDSLDGNTEESALAIANSDIKLHKRDATALVNKNSGGATYMANGVYYTVLDATDTNTAGPLVIYVHVAGALPVRVECMVLPADIYDANVVGTIRPRVDVHYWQSSAVPVPAVTGVPKVDPSHWLGTALATPDAVGHPKVTVKDGSGPGEIGLSSGSIDQVLGLANNSINAAVLADSAVDKITDELISYQAKIWYTRDRIGAADRYGCQWYRAVTPLLTGVSDVTIRVFERNVDGDVIVSETAMFESGSEHYFYYDEEVFLLDEGKHYVMEVKATINSFVYTQRQPISRDR